ncbi:MAG TPA: hypothetical protein DCQ52_10000, partial [Acidimicrobiaceae bacterium]|nr:hypothetical protein [Acidimicrobiaceae bacterium]
MGMGLLIGVSTLLCGGSLRAGATVVAAAVGATVVGLAANLPWVLSLSGSDGWTSIVGVPVASARSLGIVALSRFLADGG